jgi:hypothetical protein
MFVRIYAVRRSPLHVILDPMNSFCSEGLYGGKPSLQVRLMGSFTNRSKYPMVLRYAYIRGTTDLMHFINPIQIPAGMVTWQDEFFIVTRPKRPVGDPYWACMVFVEAGGTKFRQKVKLRHLRAPQVSPQDSQHQGGRISG